MSDRWYGDRGVRKRWILPLYANGVGIEETGTWEISNIFLLKPSKKAHGIGHSNEKNGLNVSDII